MSRYLTEARPAEPVRSGYNEDEKAKLDAFLASATSENTRRSYRSAIRQYQRSGGPLPATADDIVRYLLLASERYRVATLQLHLSALSAWHAFQGVVDPVVSAPVRQVLKGIKRSNGQPQQKAPPLRLQQLGKICHSMTTNGGQPGKLSSVRDKALLLLGFLGAFRRSELVAIDVSDLSFVADGLEIRIRHSKTDQTGQGLVKAIPATAGELCAVTAVRDWLSVAGIESGAVFRPVNQWQQLSEKRLTPSAVNQILKRACTKAGVDDALRFSGHSLRRGLATEAARSGASFEAIRKQGSWKNDTTVRGYIEEGSRFKDNVVSTLFDQNQEHQA